MNTYETVSTPLSPNSNVLSLMQKKKSLTPEEFSADLRKEGKVFWCNEENFWIVTDFHFAEKLLKSPSMSANRTNYFATRMKHIDPATVGNFFGVVQNMMVASDPPKHTLRRKLGSAGISDHLLDDFRPRVEKTVESLLKQILERPNVDSRLRSNPIEFVTDIAVELPSITLADLFGVPQEERLFFYSCANHMTQFFGAGSGCPFSQAKNADDSASQLRDYFHTMIAKRRKNPKQDFISCLVENQDSLGLDDSEVISQAIMMLVAGKVTTTDQISNNMYALLTSRSGRSKAWNCLQPEQDQMSRAIEEATRLDPAVNFVFRVVKSQLELDGKVLQEGDVVFISIHAVNRDPEIFSDPGSFSMGRTRNPHLSYGHGTHYCLGAKLARIQMNALFGRLLIQFPHLSLDPERPSIRKHESIAFSGFTSLPLIF